MQSESLTRYSGNGILVRGEHIVKGWIYQGFAVLLILILHSCCAQRAQAQPANAFIPKLCSKSGLELERRTQAEPFLTVGRRSADLVTHRVLKPGYNDEVWMT